MKNTKKRYRGEFNWHGEIFHLYAWAYSLSHAKVCMVMQLTEKLDQTFRKLNNHFLRSDNYKVEEAKDDQGKDIG